MQIEDYEYSEEVVKNLDKSLLLLASKYVPKTSYAELDAILSAFERKLIKK